MVDGVLYTSTAFCHVCAIDPATGRNLWIHDPGTWKKGKYTSKGMQHRGVAYWRDGDDARILIGTGDNRLIALDALTGKPIPSFGVNGEVDLVVVGLQRPLLHRPLLPQRLHPLPNLLLPSPRRQLRLLLRRQLRQVARR